MICGAFSSQLTHSLSCFVVGDFNVGPTGTSSVSRHHANIIVEGEGSLFVEDLSSFGTFRHSKDQARIELSADHRKASSGNALGATLEGDGWAPDSSDKTPWHIMAPKEEMTLVPIAGLVFIGELPPMKIQLSTDGKQFSNITSRVTKRSSREEQRALRSSRFSSKTSPLAQH